MKKPLVAIIILLLSVAVGVLYWKLRKSGGVDEISLPDVQDLRSIIRKNVIGVKEEADGSYTFTDKPKEGMTIIELPSPDKYKGDQYYFGPGIIFPPESEEDEQPKRHISD